MDEAISCYSESQANGRYMREVRAYTTLRIEGEKTNEGKGDGLWYNQIWEVYCSLLTQPMVWESKLSVNL
jgi:hypothetical protein